ncbi:hypothetical protein Tco_0898987 [Tanacetum coccineum]
MEQMTSICEMVGQYMQKKEEEKRIAEDQAAKDRDWKIPICYNDDDDEKSSIPLKDIIFSGLPPVENLVPTPSESEDASNGQCDLPVYDDFPESHLVTFSNPLFDIDDDCTLSDDESFSEEDVPMENFKIFSNPLFDLYEEIIATKVNLIQNEVLESITSIPLGIDSFDAESNLIKSLLNRNTSIDSSFKIDSLLDEFHRIRDSLMEEIDLFLTPDDSMPPGIETDDYDSEGDIIFFEELLTDDSLSLPELSTGYSLKEKNEAKSNKTEHGFEKSVKNRGQRPPWKGVVRFGKKGKLAPRFVGPFEILERIKPVAYRLRLPKELSSVQDTFHVSNLKKCLADANLHVPLDEIKVDKTLRFVEEPLEIMDREVKNLKCSKIPIVKVRWNFEHGPEFTWEREDHMKAKYPQLFGNAIVETNG